MQHSCILHFVVYLLFVATEGKNPSTVLRGSVQSSESITDKDVLRYLQPEDLMELSLWDYMKHVDENVSEDEQYSRFRALIAAVDRKDDLKELTGITLLAPHNDGISLEMKDFLLESDNKQILEEVVEYHMIPRIISYLSSEFKQVAEGGASVTTFTVAGENIDILVNEHGVQFNSYAHAIAYSLANESIIYKIDRLLIPPTMNSKIPEEVLMTNMKDSDYVVPKADKKYEFPITIPNGFSSGGILDNNADETFSGVPSIFSSDAPSSVPSDTPSLNLSGASSFTPSDAPSMRPSVAPSNIPSIANSDNKDKSFSDAPSTFPSDSPSSVPSDTPSINLNGSSSSVPSDMPFLVQSITPSNVPSDTPSMNPGGSSAESPGIVSEDNIDATSSVPSPNPSSFFSLKTSPPSKVSSSIPSSMPSSIPSSLPSSIPSSLPSSIISSVPSSISSSLVPFNAVREESNERPTFNWNYFSHGGVKKKFLH